MIVALDTPAGGYGVTPASRDTPVLGVLRAAIRGLGRERVVAAEERLVAAAQVDASAGHRSAVVPAEVVGLPVRDGGQAVDAVSAERAVEAIRVQRAARGGGPTPTLRRLKLPGRSIAQLPVRNLARNPRRTLMTAGAGGRPRQRRRHLVDGGVDPRHRRPPGAGDAANGPDRTDVQLARPEASNGPTGARIAALPGVDRIQPGLTVGATVAGSRGSLDVARPRLRGDGVTVVRDRVRIAGVHANPVRAFAYLDQRDAVRLGLGGIANTVTVTPAPGTSPVDLQRSLFGREGVASARQASSLTDAVQKSVDGFNSSIDIVLVIALSLAVLVGFTASSVAVEERRRELATMFAFGLGPPSGMRVAMTESLVTGVLGRLVGTALGAAIGGWVVGSLLADVFPDLDATLVIGPTTMALAAVVGVVAVTLAPLLTLRRLRTMDVSSTLRVME